MDPGSSQVFRGSAAAVSGPQEAVLRPVGSTKIMFLSSCVRGGGAGWSLYYLLKHLDRQAVEPLVVVPETGIFQKHFDALEVNVVIPTGMPERTAQLRFERNTAFTAAASYGLNLLSSAAAVPRIVSLIRRERIRLVYCNNMMVKPIGGLAAQLAGVPCVLHVRNLHEHPGNVLLYCQGVARLPVVRTVISNSHASAMPYKAAVPHKVHVVHNGIDLDEYGRDVETGLFRAAFGFGYDEIIVGFTGNLIPRKGLQTLLRAAARVLSERANVTFVIAGRVPIGGTTDYQARLEALAAELGILERVRFVGFLGDVRHAVRDFDVLVLPSLQEPFGRSIIEAMALGTPVVASRVGGIPEIISDGVDGLLVPAGDTEALATAIGRLIDDALLRDRLSRAAASKVINEFDVTVLTRQIERLLLETANGGLKIDP